MLNPFHLNAKPSSNRTHSLPGLLPNIVEAGLSGNRQRLELLTLGAIRSVKAEFPELAAELAALLTASSPSGATLRSAGTEPPPTDTEAGFALLRIESTTEAEEPILNPSVETITRRFMDERTKGAELLREGILPPRTLLLKGEPGTGKTMLAGWIARQLNLPFVVLDLATSISSYLGKTGANLRRSLDYARATPCVLLLDEFDAIAKRRDDTTEHGELKRIVNVLLKELEVWPLHSVLVAATNHPELLDPAIQRRFDVIIDMPLPDQEQRQLILARACGRFASDLPPNFLATVARARPRASGSDLDTLARSVVRRHIVEKRPLVRSFVEAIQQQLPGKIASADVEHFISALHQTCGMTVREIADLMGKGSTTIHHHLKKLRT